MLKSLYGKIALILFVLFLVIGLLNIFQTLMTTKLHIQEVDQRLNRSLAEYLTSERDFFENGHANVPELKKTFENLMHINPSIELYLLSPEGKILSYSAPPGKVKRESVDMVPLKKFINGTDNLPILGDDPRDPNRKKIFTAAPIHSQGIFQGYLYVILGGEEYDSVFQRLERSYILRLGLWITIGGAVFVFLMGLFLLNILTRRIKILSSALDSFKQKNFSRPIDFPGWHPKDRGDEIDRLGNVTLQMSERIIDQINTIKQVDNLRREMISDISHDLRTPLTSLQGHLETLLLKRGQMKKAEQENHLHTALKQSERLSRLIADLYELAKLDSPDIELKKEPFHLGELLQDILQKYQPAAEKKEVDLRAEFPKSLPLVHGDIGLIERAIQNLIDNSLSHSRPGGNIILALSPEAEKISVKVIDDGAGINRKDLPHIFDRFYHGQKRKKQADKDYSSGLGLAITKRILDLHNSPVKVESEPDKRTVFTFYLPVSKT